jgi:hypothetical protein
MARAREVQRWYAELESALTGGRAMPDPQPADPLADERLVRTVDHDLRSPDGSATASAVRVVWTGDHLDAARRLEAVLVESARQAGFPGTFSSSPRRPALAQLWPRPRRPRPAAPA